MPTYEYHCESCDQNFDVVQSFHDEPLTACPTCGSPVRKVFGNVGIVFKGTGFYKNDSRKKAGVKAAGGDASPSAGSDSSGSPSDGNGTAPSDASSSKPESPAKKPAPAAPATSGTKDSGSGSASS